MVRADGLLFLYEEVNEALAASAAEGEDGSETVSDRWERMMAPYLDPDFEFNGAQLQKVRLRFLRAAQQTEGCRFACTRPAPQLLTVAPPACGWQGRWST